MAAAETMITLRSKIFAIFHRSPADLAEPPWAEALPTADERFAASEYWHEIVKSIRTPRASHIHAALRLVVARIIADRTSGEILRGGAGTATWQTFADASRLALAIEIELGLLPRRRRGSA
jgi:hypothetical protein